MDTISANAAKSSSAAFFALVKNPFKFRLFLLKNLPAAYFSGVKIESLTEASSVISIPYK